MTEEVTSPFVARYKCACGYWIETGYDLCEEAIRAAKRIVLDHFGDTKCEQDSELWEIHITGSGTRFWPGDLMPPQALPLPRE